MVRLQAFLKNSDGPLCRLLLAYWDTPYLWASLRHALGLESQVNEAEVMS